MAEGNSDIFGSRYRSFSAEPIIEGSDAKRTRKTTMIYYLFVIIKILVYYIITRLIQRTLSQSRNSSGM